MCSSDLYFFDAEAIKEGCDGGNLRMSRAEVERIQAEREAGANTSVGGGVGPKAADPDGRTRFNKSFQNAVCLPVTSRNKRSVWTVATSPFPEAHFATFPPKLIEPCIKAGTSERGCCAKCGAPWEREITVDYKKNRPSAGDDPRSRGKDRLASARESYGSQGWRGNNLLRDAKILGWRATCKCAAAVVPCTVLDPFGGAGTTGLVADRLQRNAILIELNPAYAEMARKRIFNDAPLFAEAAE